MLSTGTDLLVVSIGSLTGGGAGTNGTVVLDFTSSVTATMPVLFVLAVGLALAVGGVGVVVAAFEFEFQGGSMRSRRECQAKASRFSAARVIARNFLPWPKLCSSS